MCVCAPYGGEELSTLQTRCGGGLPRSPREGAEPPSIPSKGGSAPYPPLTGRVRGRTGQAALLPAARAGVEARQLGENTRRCMETHIACAPGGGEELSTLQTRCYPLAPRTGGGIPPTPLLRAGCVAARDRPPSCLRQGRGVAPQASRPLAYRKGGGLHPRRAALLRTARAGGCTPGEPPSCLRQGRKASYCN